MHKEIESDDSIPTTGITADEFPMPIWKLFVISGLCKSGNDARRLIIQGGAYVIGIKRDKGDREKR